MSDRNTMPENITVIIPSYCPDDRLPATVHGLIAAGADDIAVINDGSGKEYEPGSIFEKSGPHTFDGAGAPGHRRSV